LRFVYSRSRHVVKFSGAMVAYPLLRVEKRVGKKREKPS
jgi:hypothetical protein